MRNLTLILFASTTLDIHSKVGTMTFRSLVALTMVVVPLANCAPLTLQERQTPNGVPDYVLKYGKQPGYPNTLDLSNAVYQD